MSSHLDRTSLIRNWINYMAKRLHQNISLVRKSGQSRAGKIGPSCRSSSQSEHRSRFIVPARGASHIISKGNRTEWSPIWSVIIRVITKSDDRAAGVRFVYHEDDYRPNWTTRSLVTN